MTIGDASSLLGAALTMRVGVDATGVEAELASKLTGAERVAVTSAERTSASVGRVYDASSAKITAATLRQTAAQESYNRLLRAGETDTVRLARSQAALISAQRTVSAEQAKLATSTAAVNRERSAFLGGNVKQLLAIGAIAEGVHLIKQSVGEASDLSETVNKVDVVFGGAAASINRLGDTAAEKLGQSKQQAEEAAATFGNFFTALKIGEGQAATMSTRLVQLAADLASFNNADPTEVLQNLRSGLAGEVEPLRKYGIDLSEATLKQEAMREGLVETATGTLPTAIKAQAAYHLILQQTTTAQGDFERTASGQANQQRILAANIKDTEAALGQGLLPITRDLVTVANDDLIPVLKVAAGAFDAVASHDTIRRVAEGTLAVGAAALVIAKLKNVYTSTVDTLFNGGRTAARVGQNTAIAESYNLIAAAAGRAAVAETAAAGAGMAAGGASAGSLIGAGMIAGLPTTRGLLAGAGRRLLRGGLLATGGMLVGDVVPGTAGNVGSSTLYGAAAGSIIPGVGTLAGAVGGTAYGGTTALLHSVFGERFGADSPKPVEFNAAGQALVDQYGGVDQALAALREQNAARDAAQIQQHQQRREALNAYTGDPFATRTHPDKAAMDAAVTSASTAAAQARRAVASAERDLAAARRSDMTTAADLADSEDALTTAKERAAAASRKLADAEEKRRKGLAPTALRPGQLLHRLDRTIGEDKATLESIGVLSGEGLSRAGITSLLQADQENAGTLKYAADHMTEQTVREMNRKFRELRRLGSPVVDYLSDDKKARQAGERAAEQFALGFDNRLSQQRRRHAHRQARNDYFSPQDPRAGALGPGVRRIG